MAQVRIKKKTGFVPHSVMDGLVDLHAAMDPDTGHFICHYYALAPAIVEIGGEDFPALNIGEYLTVLIGRGAAEAVRREGERLMVSSIGRGRVNNLEVDDDSLALAMNFYRYSRGTIEVYRLGEHVAFVSEPKNDTPVALILWRRKTQRQDKHVLTV